MEEAEKEKELAKPEDSAGTVGESEAARSNQKVEELEKPQEAKPESRLNRFVLRAVRWLIGILIIAGLGAMAVVFTLYVPLQQRLTQTQSDLEQASSRVTELESEVERLATFEEKNKALQGEMDKTELHVAVLSARADVAAAQLALEQDDAPKARLALSKTGATIEKLEGLLKSGEKALAADMQSRLELALEGIGANDFAAASDLSVLANSLIELENAYFAVP